MYNIKQDHTLEQVLTLEVMPILKTCMDDTWSPDNRLVATLVTTLILNRVTPGDEQLRDLYPELLKRLDDSQDEVQLRRAGLFFA